MLGVWTQAWKRLRPFSGLAIMLLIAAPWHILATLRNPPYFSLSLHSGPTVAGPLEYHGFFWLPERFESRANSVVMIRPPA